MEQKSTNGIQSITNTMILSLLFSLFMFSCDNGEQEIVVVPKGYKGYALIIFNQKSGEPTKYKEGKRLYEIPANGILKTQFVGNYGSVGLSEFYYEKVAPENKLPSFVEIKKVPKGIVGLMGPSGTIKKSANSEERIEFREFYIGTKSDIEQAQAQIGKLDIVKLTE